MPYNSCLHNSFSDIKNLILGFGFGQLCLTIHAFTINSQALKILFAVLVSVGYALHSCLHNSFSGVWNFIHGFSFGQ